MFELQKKRKLKKVIKYYNIFYTNKYNLLIQSKLQKIWNVSRKSKFLNHNGLSFHCHLT